MKYFLLFPILFLFFFSCSKDEIIEESKTIDQAVFGRWLLGKESFEQTSFTRSSRFGEYEKGIVIFDDNTMIERSEGGICIGEFCLTENYYGTYTFDSSDNSLEIKVVNYAGPQSYKLKIIEVNTEKLLVKKIQ